MKARCIFLTLMVAMMGSWSVSGALAESRLNACWVHGNVIEPENRAQVVKTDRRGNGIYFYGQENTFNWFHIPITTPVITENTRVSLQKIFVLFQTLNNAQITNVHIWDGNTRIKAFDGLARSGSHLNTDAYNTFPISPMIALAKGMDLVVGVKFGAKTSQGLLPGIFFPAAGADFYRSW